MKGESMKSAEEWLNEVGLEPLEWDEVEKLILKVQSDALKAAAEKCVETALVVSNGYKENHCEHCNDGSVAASNSGYFANRGILSLLPEE